MFITQQALCAIILLPGIQPNVTKACGREEIKAHCMSHKDQGDVEGPGAKRKDTEEISGRPHPASSVPPLFSSLDKNKVRTAINPSMSASREGPPATRAHQDQPASAVRQKSAPGKTAGIPKVRGDNSKNPTHARVLQDKRPSPSACWAVLSTQPPMGHLWSGRLLRFSGL